MTVNVRFRARNSKAENCFCSGCHAGGKVIKMLLPETLYYDGKDLSTRYREYWLCQECVEKLKKVLDNPEEEK